jgi:hypothetical protein
MMLLYLELLFTAPSAGGIDSLCFWLLIAALLLLQLAVNSTTKQTKPKGDKHMKNSGNSVRSCIKSSVAHLAEAVGVHHVVALGIQ